MSDTPRHLSDAPTYREVLGDRAVVIGAGIGGLAAAAALSRYFREIVVLERDELPVHAQARAGTPQSLHGHALLTGGLRALCDLIPGFDQNLLDAGAVTVRAGQDVRFEQMGFNPIPQRDLGWDFVCISRPMNELTLRRRVEQLGNVLIRSGCRAEALLTTPDGARITGVGFATPQEEGETLVADLVVEASGSGALTLKLLEESGRPLPEETRIGVSLGYSSAVFRRPATADPNWKICGVFADPSVGGRGALLLPMEGDRWMVTLVGRGSERPPRDWPGFMGFLESLPGSTLFDALKDAERIGEPALYRFAASIRRHFERLPDFPSGLLPFSDAICRFNPAFGQGMSIAAQEARLLDRLLAATPRPGEPPAKLARDFFAAAKKLIDTPWGMIVGQDFLYPETRGERPADFDQTSAFGAALVRLAVAEPDVHKLWQEVIHLLKPSSVLTDPDLVRRVKAVIAPSATPAEASDSPREQALEESK
ncbi:NAD(P)-binding protein [Phenylobacterium sp.]|uniref:NAD(P)/FAD-dependent oxidoreductase n=1 Tax=Phenylobacterium sp. TaxID=1871053 RepID=UPI0012225FB7|nr:NAD(P)-binding protein [Phenylobacterium sp.]THD53610.1 MAG: squalene monooxygenase [Phenylobacterium sp.]